MKPTIFGPKLWLCIASAKSYAAAASSAKQSIALYCDTANMDYNSTTGTISICPRLEERHHDAKYLALSGGSMSVSAYAEPVSYSSNLFLVAESTKSIRVVFRGTGQIYFKSMQTSSVTFYLCNVTLSLYDSNNTLLKSVYAGPLSHNISTYLFSTGEMELEYECDFNEATYCYFTVTASRATPITTDFTLGYQGPSGGYAACGGNWDDIVGTLFDTVATAGEVNYAILDNYIRPD